MKQFKRAMLMPWAGGGPAAPSSLLTSLVAYWKLDEASGSRFDSTANGSTLTDNNTVTQVVGKVAFAAQFTAANSESLSAADNAALSMGDIGFTIACWAFLDSVTARRAFVLKAAGSANTSEYMLRTSGTGAAALVTFSVGNGVASGAVSSVAPLVAGQWYFLAGRYDSVNDLVRLRVDTTDLTPVSYAGGSFDSANTFTLGRWIAGGDFMDGAIDEVGIWKRHLTDAELTTLRNGGNGVTYPFLGT